MKERQGERYANEYDIDDEEGDNPVRFGAVLLKAAGVFFGCAAIIVAIIAAAIYFFK